ncbi:MAG TPA: hypothetical protein VHH34_22015, partial [Pseudonocardiaceae bacterium]|nr:hypothetical protein [Pseudonocardiaceae bacterium]
LGRARAGLSELLDLVGPHGEQVLSRDTAGIAVPVRARGLTPARRALSVWRASGRANQVRGLRH